MVCLLLNIVRASKLASSRGGSFPPLDKRNLEPLLCRTLSIYHISLPDLIKTYYRAVLTSKANMSIPAAKRQRTDAASYALSKPFRSPMKTPSAPSAIKTPVPVLQDSSDPVQAGENDATKHIKPAKSLLQGAATPFRMKAIKNPYSSHISSTALNADPDIAALIKTVRQLEEKLRELKEELDTAEQARRIEADSEKMNPGGAIDGELSQLILKWRAASRQAAEELFTSVRDRVNRYAGRRLLTWHAINDRFSCRALADPRQDGWSKGMEGDARETETVPKRVGYRVASTTRLGRWRWTGCGEERSLYGV